MMMKNDTTTTTASMKSKSKKQPESPNNVDVFCSLPEVHVLDPKSKSKAKKCEKRKSEKTTTIPPISTSSSSCDDDNLLACCLPMDKDKKDLDMKSKDSSKKHHPHHHSHHSHSHSKKYDDDNERLTPSAAAKSGKKEKESKDRKQFSTKSTDNNPQSSSLDKSNSSCVQGIESLRKDLGLQSTRKPELFRKKSPISSSVKKKSDRKKLITNNNSSAIVGDPFVTGRSNLSGVDTRKFKINKCTSGNVTFHNADLSNTSMMSSGGGGGRKNTAEPEMKKKSDKDDKQMFSSMNKSKNMESFKRKIKEKSQHNDDKPTITIEQQSKEYGIEFVVPFIIIIMIVWWIFIIEKNF